jgi:hypothetical protein
MFNLSITLPILSVSDVPRRSLLHGCMQTKQDPREPVFLMALKLHAKLCLSMIIFLICVLNNDALGFDGQRMLLERRC